MAVKRTLNQADVNFLKKTFTTKTDLKSFATKADLKNFATKKDLDNCVSKDYLDVKLDQQKDEIIDEFKKFRSNFYDKIDPILKEVVTKREERTIQTEQIKRHEDRLQALEKTCPHPGRLATSI